MAVPRQVWDDGGAPPYTGLVMRRLSLLAALLLVSACGSDPPSSLLDGVDTGDVASFDTVDDDDAASDTGSSDVGGADAADAAGGGDADAASDVDATTECETLGCACDDDLDCASGYCLDLADGSRACSELCDGTCSAPGYTCRDLVNAEGDVVRLCVADREILCQPCDVPADCGRLDAACAELADGETACLPACDEDGLCPIGSTCEGIDGSNGSFCVPDAGLCDGCLDRDDDGYGVGTDCLGLDHDDLDPSSYEGAPELCDGVDNDGDGDIDEDFDLTSDPTRCGACDVACEVAGGSVACVDSACVIETCPEGYGDCDEDYATGCEVDLYDAPLCGACDPPEDAVGAACGVCGSGTFVCTDAGVVCEGDEGDEARNACGGCATLADPPGGACGTCDLDAFVCAGADATVCDGDDTSCLCEDTEISDAARPWARYHEGARGYDAGGRVTFADADLYIATGAAHELDRVGGTTLITLNTFIANIYRRNFNRSPDRAGLDYWVDEFAGGLTFAELRTYILTAASTESTVRVETRCGDPLTFTCAPRRTTQASAPYAVCTRGAVYYIEGGAGVTRTDRPGSGSFYAYTARPDVAVRDRTWGELNEHIATIYRDEVGRTPDCGGLAYWAGEYAAGRLSWADLRPTIAFASSEPEVDFVLDECGGTL